MFFYQIFSLSFLQIALNLFAGALAFPSKAEGSATGGYRLNSIVKDDAKESRNAMNVLSYETVDTLTTTESPVTEAPQAPDEQGTTEVQAENKEEEKPLTTLTEEEVSAKLTDTIQSLESMLSVASTLRDIVSKNPQRTNCGCPFLSKYPAYPYPSPSRCPHARKFISYSSAPLPVMFRVPIASMPPTGMMPLSPIRSQSDFSPIIMMSRATLPPPPPYPAPLTAGQPQFPAPPMIIRYPAH